MKKKSSLLIVMTMFSVILFAQHDDHNDAYNEKDNHQDQLHSEHTAHKNHIALFSGATTNLDHESTAYSLGLDYEYRMGKLFGVGLMGEIVFAKSKEFIIGVPVFIHPVKGLKCTISPIAIIAEEHLEVDPHSDPHYEDSHGESVNKDAQFGARIGLAYDFHIWKFSVGPAVSFDVANTQALVYGVNIGLGF